MKAVQVSDLRGPDGVAVAEVGEPQPTAGTVLVEVKAAGIAYPDLLLSRGEYQVKPDLPFTLGLELAGVVGDGSGSSPFSPGERVVALVLGGAFAERALAPEASTFRLPPGLSFEEGAALVANYHTAHFGLLRRALLRPGERVLVHGGGGGVGTAAAQVAKAAGATVIAVVSSDEKEAAAREAGADQVVRTEGWREALADQPVDVVYDPVGGDRVGDSLRVLAPEGRLVVIGFTAGSIPEVKVNRLLLRNVSLVGAGWGHFGLARPAYMREVAEDLERMVAEGHVKPLVGRRYGFEEVPQALREIAARRAVGKLVLDPARTGRAH